jgi:hypothetical protein
VSKFTSLTISKIRSSFVRLPFPATFSRIVSVLLTYVDRDTLQAWPSQKRLSDHVGCHEKTVKRNLQAARQLGLLKIESVDACELQRRVGGKRRLAPHHRFTIYTIDISHPLWKGSPQDVEQAKGVIKKSTHRGVDERFAAKRQQT